MSDYTQETGFVREHKTISSEELTKDTLTAALPHIEKQIRAQAAADIWEYWDACGDLIDDRDSARQAIDAIAAQIAKGAGDIAALITEVERLRAQIEAVKGLHKPVRLYESEENCPHTGKRNSESEDHVDDFHIDSSDGYMAICLAMPTKEQICASCREDDGSEVAYPCPTIRALDGEAA